ncbi:hypothetical protein FOZ63_028509 [Perkinsus olseni]|uniref:Uncharacterized protein n=1 Tax=Perkinsus olseni TaxID=32597 RepID=A0A7J6S3B1_PEROL|nr:hypothetical protein FOZ63_028509 [Perkinsus olseni]
MPQSNKAPTGPEVGGVRDVSSNHLASTTHVYYHFDRHKPIGNRFIMGLFNSLIMVLVLLHHHIHLPKYYYTIPSTTIIPLVVVATANLIFTTVTATAVQPLLRFGDDDDDDDDDRLRESYDGHLDYEAHVGKYFGDRTGVWIKRLVHESSSSNTHVIAMYQGVTYHFKDTHKRTNHNENDWIKFNINKRVERDIIDQASTKDEAARTIKFLKTVRYNLIRRAITTRATSSSLNGGRHSRSCALNPLGCTRSTDGSDDGGEWSWLSEGVRVLPRKDVYLQGEVNGYPVYFISKYANSDDEEKKRTPSRTPERDGGRDHPHLFISAAVYNNVNATSSSRCIVYDTEIHTPGFSMVWNLEHHSAPASPIINDQGETIPQQSLLALGKPPEVLSPRSTLTLYDDGPRSAATGLLEIPQQCLSRLQSDGKQHEDVEEVEEEEGHLPTVVVALYDMNDMPLRRGLWRYDGVAPNPTYHTEDGSGHSHKNGYHHHHGDDDDGVVVSGNIWMYWIDISHVKFVSNTADYCIYTLVNTRDHHLTGGKGKMEEKLLKLNPHPQCRQEYTPSSGHGPTTSSIPSLGSFTSLRYVTIASSLMPLTVMHHQGLWEVTTTVEQRKKKSNKKTSRKIGFPAVSPPQRIPIGFYTIINHGGGGARSSSSSSVNIFANGGAIIDIQDEPKIHLPFGATIHHKNAPAVFVGKGRADILYDPITLNIIMDYRGITNLPTSTNTYILTLSESIPLMGGDGSSPYDHINLRSGTHPTGEVEDNEIDDSSVERRITDDSRSPGRRRRRMTATQSTPYASVDDKVYESIVRYGQEHHHYYYTPSFFVKDAQRLIDSTVAKDEETRPPAPGPPLPARPSDLGKEKGLLQRNDESRKEEGKAAAAEASSNDGEIVIADDDQGGLKTKDGKEKKKDGKKKDGKKKDGKKKDGEKKDGKKKKKNEDGKEKSKGGFLR